MKQVGVVDPAVYVVIAGFLRDFSFPAFYSVACCGGVAGRDLVGPAAVQMHADDFHVFRRVRVAHGGVGTGQVVRKGLRHHDDVVKTGGCEVRAQVAANEGVKCRG